VDGSSNTHGSGAGIVILTPEGDAVECAMRFDFKATNNQAEYEALLAGLRVCVALGADEIEIFSDSQVVVNQVLDEYQARDGCMMTYLEIAKEACSKSLKGIKLPRSPRRE
jgi:ribonuclease HI